MRTAEMGIGQTLRRRTQCNPLIRLGAVLGMRHAQVLTPIREDSPVTATLSSLLTQLVLAFAALVGDLTASTPAPPTQPEAQEQHPSVRVHFHARGADAALVDASAVRECASAPSICSAARMRWQVTLPAASVRRCASGCAEG
jgi:hypothetical protein